MTFDTVFNFVKNNLVLLIELLILLISVVTAFIKKRPVFNKLDTIKKDILEMLPRFIKIVEKPGNGAEKKESVISLIHSYLMKKYKFNSFDYLDDFISEAIEDILTAPEKKER